MSTMQHSMKPCMKNANDGFYSMYSSFNGNDRICGSFNLLFSPSDNKSGCEQFYPPGHYVPEVGFLREKMYLVLVNILWLFWAHRHMLCTVFLKA